MDNYENALNKSVRKKETRKQVFREGEVKGLKKGILLGSIATIVVTGLGTMGYKGLTTKRTNPSSVAGIEAVSHNAHLVRDPITGYPTDNYDYWVDYGGVVDEYNPETMDLDSFIYGTYSDFPEDTRDDNMDGIMRRLFLNGYTEYDTFLEYCESKGLTEVVNGKVVVDKNKYCKAMKKYIRDYNEKVELEEKVEEFKRGKI